MFAIKPVLQRYLINILAGIAMLWVHLPYRWQISVGRTLGLVMYYLAHKRRRIAAINIALCFTELDQVAQAHLVKKSFLSAGMAIVEGFMSWFMPSRAFSRLHFETIGQRYVDEAIQQGKGVIFCSGHMMCLEIVGRAYGLQYDFSVVYKPVRNKSLQKLFEKYRGRHYKAMLAHRDVKQIVRRLRAGEMIWYAPDQDFGIKSSIFADFMGVQTATLTATAKLAQLGNAIVVPVLFHRLNHDKGYALDVLPALQDFPSGDHQKDARRYNEILEAYIRRYPDQYHWLHRRFKTRPSGQAKIY